MTTKNIPLGRTEAFGGKREEEDFLPCREETHLVAQDLDLLLIEDQPSDVALALEAIQEGMSDFSWNIESVPSMSEALSLLSKNKFDVALVDLTLTDMEGMQTLGVLTMTAPSLPLVVYTGREDDALLEETLASGAVTYIKKSGMTPEGIRSALLSALARRTP